MQVKENTPIELVSVIIPVLNEEKLLPGCLESLKNQDYRGRYEIIVADNGSNDNSINIARQFEVRILFCPEKKSVFYAREVGANAARGDILVQADADTIYPRDWLSHIVEQFSAYPEAVALTGRFLYRDPPRWAKLEYYFRNWGNRVTSLVMGRPIMVSGATLAFRRRSFLAVNGYTDITYSPDQYGICKRLSKVGKVLYDSKIKVLTSSRTVNKPFRIVMRQGFGNFGRWFGIVAGQNLASFRDYTNQKRSRRVAARLSIPLVSIIFFIFYGYFIPGSPVFGEVYSKANPNQKIVAITFDDGPNEPYTSQVLDVLNKYNARATFFLIGKNVELYPETARRILAEGSVIGNHSYSHKANHALTEQGSRDLIVAQRIILENVGVLPHLYRPPHGRKSPWELQNVKKAGLIEVAWSISTKELSGWSPARMAQAIVKQAKPGAIILLHDGYGTEHNNWRADKSKTVEALALMLEQLQAQGYQFVTVPELLNVPSYLDNQVEKPIMEEVTEALSTR